MLQLFNVQVCHEMMYEPSNESLSSSAIREKALHKGAIGAGAVLNLIWVFLFQRFKKIETTLCWHEFVEVFFRN